MAQEPVSAGAARNAAYPVAPLFLERWSPRAFGPDALTQDELMTMLEAARWAASSSNIQPWRFVYARRDTDAWPRLLDLLVPVNRGWAQHAAALVFFVSHALMPQRGSDELVPSPTHAYDTGTASGYFALQAHLMGWHAHGMAGFDHERAVETLKLPPAYQVHAVYAVGRIGDPASLPEQLREREHPNDRLPLEKLAFEGALSS
jgi:nitroreductase